MKKSTKIIAIVGCSIFLILVLSTLLSMRAYYRSFRYWWNSCENNFGKIDLVGELEVTNKFKIYHIFTKPNKAILKHYTIFKKDDFCFRIGDDVQSEIWSCDDSCCLLKLTYSYCSQKIPCNTSMMLVVNLITKKVSLSPSLNDNIEKNLCGAKLEKEKYHLKKAVLDFDYQECEPILFEEIATDEILKEE